MEGRCEIPWWNALWAVAGSVLGCISTLAGFVLWPTDNVLIFPEQEGNSLYSGANLY